jgi:transposase
VQQLGACLVAIKQADQQAIFSLHRIRSQLLKFRIMQSNGLRGLLYEFGIVLPEGNTQLSKAVPEAFADVEHRVPSMVLDTYAISGLGLSSWMRKFEKSNYV